jgi:hypothetical protein
MREKAPGSGGPAAGNPEGVKSGQKLFQEIKDQVQGNTKADPVTELAPAEQDIRGINPDGSSNPDEVTHVESREEADAEIAKDLEKIDEMSEMPEDEPEPRVADRVAAEAAEDNVAIRRRKATPPPAAPASEKPTNGRRTANKNKR